MADVHVPQNPLLSDEERAFLAQAARYLERPSFWLRATNLLGRPLEAAVEMLPHRGRQMVSEISRGTLQAALNWAIQSLPASINEPQRRSWFALPATVRRIRNSRHMHTAMTVTTGAVGGFFGLAGATIEVPASTLIMLRSIAQIAAEAGADLKDPATRLHCLAVFSLGSRPNEPTESAYLASRLAMATAVREASAFLARATSAEVTEALAKGTAPALVRLINQLAGRFQVVLSQKITFQAMAVTGAISAAVLNGLFTDHFNTVARYHFGMLELERKYGAEGVQHAYRLACDALATETSAPRGYAFSA